MNENQCANDVTESIENALERGLGILLRTNKEMKLGSHVRSSVVPWSSSVVQCHDCYSLMALVIYRIP